MTWQLSLSICLLYICAGILIFNRGTSNNDLSPTTAAVAIATTACTTISLLRLSPIPTEIPAGYIPYKNSIPPWLDGMGAVWIDGNLVKRARQKKEGRSTGEIIEVIHDCPLGKTSCSSLGHPEICCNEEHTCLPTNNTLNGVYCCRSPDPISLPCDESNLRCDPGWYECPVSSNGGCCKYGQRCGQLECFNGGGPATPTTVTAATSSFNSGLDENSITGSQDNAITEVTVLRYITSANKTLTITSTWRSSRLTITAEPKTSYTQIAYSKATSTTVIDGTPINTNINGAPVTYTGYSTAATATTRTNSAAGTRAKVGRHWSWIIMTWWIIAAIFEGF